jgi:hypothetical protein
MIRIDLVDKNGAVFSAMTVQIALRVAIDIEPPNQASSLYWRLPHGCVDGLPAPRDLAGKPYVD